MFESSVNSEGIETTGKYLPYKDWFESSVNSEGIETYPFSLEETWSLRAV